MGNYINKLPDGTRLGLLKLRQIEALPSATKIIGECPKSFRDIPEDKVFVAVVWNPPWDAAIICDTEGEFDYVMDSPKHGDNRPTTYFLIDRGDVQKMADYPLDSDQKN